MANTLQTNLSDQVPDVRQSFLNLVNAQQATIPNSVRVIYWPRGLPITDQDVADLYFNADPFDPASEFGVWLEDKLEYLKTKCGRVESVGIDAL